MKYFSFISKKEHLKTDLLLIAPRESSLLIILFPVIVEKNNRKNRRRKKAVSGLKEFQKLSFDVT